MTLNPTETAAPLAKDVSTRDFVPEVMRASMEQPVLVDFWAPWCGPCKQLTPVLEKAIAATKGKVKFVKVNIDENQQLAQQMGIQSIPAVYAFYKGQPVDGFLGVQPESAVKQFIDKLLKLGGGQQAEAVAAALAEAEGLLEQKDVEGANAIFAEILAHDENNAPAYAGLIRVALLMNNVDEAQAMLDEAPDTMKNDKALAAVAAQLSLVRQAEQAGSTTELAATVEKNPDDHQARYDLAIALNAKGEFEPAIDQLLEIIRRNKTWEDDKARQQLFVIFAALGPMHDLSVAGRRKLSSILFK